MIKQFQTNLFGVLDVTNAALPYMRESKSFETCVYQTLTFAGRSGTVVMIGSRSAWRPEVKVSSVLDGGRLNSGCLVSGTW
jgi:NAD(P)-dependent dehydrogenase (short-subunit alcohol dehydrogenase family)